MELRTYLRQVWQYLLLIVVIVAVASVLVFLISSSSTRVYTAEARLVVTAGLGADGTGTDNVLAAPRVGQTYAVMATTRPVLLNVIREAGLPYDPAELARRLTVTADLDMPFLEISMTDESPTRASTTVNALADVLVEMATVPPSADAAGRGLLSVVQRAAVPDEPSGPRVLFSTALGATTALVAGLVILAVVAYVRRDPTLPPGAPAG
jgi:capsular polysaccharide biosynthesis protein